MSIFKPKKSMLVTGCSDTFMNNMELVNECTFEAQYEPAAILAQMEIARQLDRIANAMEQHWAVVVKK